MSNLIKIVTILDNDMKPIGQLPLTAACDIEGWDYDTADWGLDFIPRNMDGTLRTEKRESRTDETGHTTTFVWTVGNYVEGVQS